MNHFILAATVGDADLHRRFDWGIFYSCFMFSISPIVICLVFWLAARIVVRWRERQWIKKFNRTAVVHTPKQEKGGMFMFDKLFEFVVNSVRAEEKRKYDELTKDRAVGFANIKFERKVKDLLEPARKCLHYHRDRATHYTEELERAEKKLREEGVDMEVTDPTTGLPQAYAGNLCSGAIYGNSTGQSAPKFQPRIDQRLLGIVERAKTKMLEHREKAVQYEKWVRVFTCSPPELRIELHVADIEFFRLES